MSNNKIIFSPEDKRDYSAVDFLNFETVLPEEYKAPATNVRFQWLSGQCVCFAITQAMSQYEKATTGSYNTYSPGLLYANRESNDYQGEGWYVRKGLKQAYKYGTCLESDFPFPESYEKERKQFLADQEHLLKLAENNKITSYFRCKTEEEIKRCIMQCGSVIVSSSSNIKFFWSANITNETIEGAKGGHAYILVGWDKNGWIAQDSYTIFRPILGRPHIAYDFKFDEAWGILK